MARTGRVSQSPHMGAVATGLSARLVSSRDRSHFRRVVQMQQVPQQPVYDGRASALWARRPSAGRPGGLD